MLVKFQHSTPLKRFDLIEDIHDMNVNIPERMMSVTAGVYLTLSGIRTLFSSPKSSLTKILSGSYLLKRGFSGRCNLYSWMNINTNKIHNINIKCYYTVNKPRAEVYRFWRKLENLPLFMQHLERVEQMNNKHSRWVAKVPGNMGTISWNTEIVEDKEFFIGWQSIKGSPIYNAGKVEFRDAANGQGTEVRAIISYKAPAGALGTQVAKLLNPIFANYVREDIRNFKQFVEAGETTLV